MSCQRSSRSWPRSPGDFRSDRRSGRCTRSGARSELENRKIGGWKRAGRNSDPFCFLELYKDCQVQAVFDFAEVGKPGIRWRAVASRESLKADERASSAFVAVRRRNAAGAGKVWNVRGAVIKFPAERDVLAWHPVEGGGSVPRFVRIAGVFGEIWRTARSRGTVDGRKKDKIAT